jgi:hypothetical protein
LQGTADLVVVGGKQHFFPFVIPGRAKREPGIQR